MLGPIYRAGTREEVRAFSDRWVAYAIKDTLSYPACILESYWGYSDHFLVAEVGGEVVGVAAFREGKPSHLDLVAVAQAFGHQGIGEKLTNRVLGRLVEAGHVPVVCEIACLEDYMERILSKTPYAAHVQVV